MTGKLLAQLGWLFHVEANAQFPDPYEWPPPKVPHVVTPETQREHDRLRVTSSAIFIRAREAGFFESGLDSVFGDERDPGPAPEE